MAITLNYSLEIDKDNIASESMTNGAFVFVGMTHPEKLSITADTAMRLSIFFGTTAEFWLNLQKCYELDVARQNADKLKHIRPYEPPTSNPVP